MATGQASIVVVNNIVRDLRATTNYQEHSRRDALATANAGSALASLINGQTSQASNRGLTTLVDSGATDQFLSDGLIRRLKDHTMNTTGLKEAKTLITVVNRTLLRAITGAMYGSITDRIGTMQCAHSLSFVVSVLGQHIFSLATVMELSIPTMLEAWNPYPWSSSQEAKGYSLSRWTKTQDSGG